MERKSSKQSKVFDDEDFGACINPQTGTVLNLNRKLATSDEIEQLVLPDKLGQLERAKRLILDGQKIQKWSVLENFPLYATNNKAYTQLLELFANNTKEFNKDLQIIMGYGLTSFLLLAPFELSEQQRATTTKLLLKMLSYEEPQVSDEWVLTYEAFVRRYPSEMEHAEEYITGAFGFGATPEKRPSMMYQKVQVRKLSQTLRKDTLKRIILFNEDHNPISRRAICSIIAKALKYLPVGGGEELWKVVWGYTTDKQDIVRRQAYAVLATCPRPENLKSALELFEGKDCEWLIRNNFNNLLLTVTVIVRQFRTELKEELLFMKVLHIINRIFLSRNVDHIVAVLQSIENLMEFYGERCLVQMTVNMSQLDFSNRRIAIAFVLFYSRLQVTFRADLQPTFAVVLKKHSYDLAESIKPLLVALTECQPDFDIFMRTLNRMLEQSHWRSIQLMLERLSTWKLTRGRFDRIVLFLMKIILVTPNFLLEPVCLAFRHMILSSRKRLEFLAQLKERLSCAKVCYQRKNFVLLQSVIYQNCSWEVQKSMPSIVYAYLLNQRVSSVKMEYCKVLPKLQYPSRLFSEFMDPSEIQAKAYIRQIVKKYSQEKDQILSGFAIQAQQQINQVDSDTQRVERMFQRNKLLVEKERAYPQTEEDQVQITKQPQTQKILNTKIKTASVKKTSLIVPESKPQLKPTMPKSYSATVRPPLAITRRLQPTKK